ncbi:lyso-ornithine lipid acyltransferase [Rhodococcus sp. OK611]|uniref:lysophospholipid acyltransferase family protein n=1 Tax=unclassified Rhodococcus (in: high G+C Gram-positive bacteria) TaxID=192944 RepID=UPI000BCEFED0|nr:MULTISPECIES: lysophospholipid acyltransferase family protein [unclassified Rhodococcus (in: high G+C Gram-positive bacteria)]PTR37824.1 lyso-ornithine lipid acyltransferase [Rhodococcus sp. OK611]SNX93255.1 lyso-ornithine lipid acyltransferase [Rhodococcus sp. OK270]
MTHDWMPSSPCGDGCLPTAVERAGLARVAARFVMLAAMLLSLPVLLAGGVLPGSWRRSVQRGYARAALSGLGMRLRVRDERGLDIDPGERGVLVVAGHVSWADVLVLCALGPADFVARADLLDWPLLGTLARRMRIIPIDRARLSELPGAVDEAAERLRAGGRVVAFPEGTTWCGRAYGSFRPALFQSAVEAGALVQPVGIRYCTPDGRLDTTACFVGDQTLAASLRRTVGLRRLDVEVLLAPLEEPGADRRELARRCERAARVILGANLTVQDILDGMEERQTAAA